MSHDPNCIFCKIAEGKIPSKKVHEDDEILAFHDIHPWAPVHLLIIPKLHVPSLADIEPEHQAWLGKMLSMAPKLMKQQGVKVVIVETYNDDKLAARVAEAAGAKLVRLPDHVNGVPEAGSDQALFRHNVTKIIEAARAAGVQGK